MKNIDENHSVNSSPNERFFGKRFIVGFLLWFGIFLTFGKNFNNFVSYSINYIRPAEIENYYSPQENEKFMDRHIGEQVIFAFYCGYVLTGIPAGYLSYRFHSSRIFFLAIVVSNFLHVFNPVFIQSKGALIALHFFQGLAEGFILPSFFGIWKNWVPSNEINLLVPISYSGLFVGLLTGSGVAYQFVDDWVFPYYIFGGLSVLWLTLWLWFVYDSPSQHPTIKKEELSLFTNLQSKTSGDVPWKIIFTSIPVWAIIIGTLGQTLIFKDGIYDEQWLYHHLTFYPYAPSNGTLFTLKDPIFTPWYMEGICAILIILAACLAFYLSHRYKVPTVRIRKGFTCFGLAFGALSLLLLPDFRPKILQAIANCFPPVGVFVNPLDIAPRYASIVVGISNTFVTIVAQLIPNMFQLIFISDNGVSYQVLHLTSIVVPIIACILYGIFASGEKQEWAKGEEASST